MIWTSKTISDKMVFEQMFKSFKMRDLNVVYPNNDVFDENGYLRQIVYLAWYGTLGSGHKICKMIETFGYKVDWEYDRARKIGIKPVTDEELALR